MLPYSANPTPRTSFDAQQAFYRTVSQGAALWESPKTKWRAASVFAIIAIGFVWANHHANNESKYSRGWYIGTPNFQKDEKKGYYRDEKRYQRNANLSLVGALIATIAGTAIATTAILTRR